MSGEDDHHDKNIRKTGEGETHEPSAPDDRPAGSPDELEGAESQASNVVPGNLGTLDIGYGSTTDSDAGPGDPEDLIGEGGEGGDSTAGGLNSGASSVGFFNSGDTNAGLGNAGDFNVGFANTGNANTGSTAPSDPEWRYVSVRRYFLIGVGLLFIVCLAAVLLIGLPRLGLVGPDPSSAAKEEDPTKAPTSQVGGGGPHIRVFPGEIPSLDCVDDYGDLMPDICLLSDDPLPYLEGQVLTADGWQACPPLAEGLSIASGQKLAVADTFQSNDDWPDSVDPGDLTFEIEGPPLSQWYGALPSDGTHPPGDGQTSMPPLFMILVAGDPASSSSGTTGGASGKMHLQDLTATLKFEESVVASVRVQPETDPETGEIIGPIFMLVADPDDGEPRLLSHEGLAPDDSPFAYVIVLPDAQVLPERVPPLCEEPTEEPTDEPPDSSVPVPPQGVCGDQVCNPATENSDLCPSDCQCVDDGVCSPGEGENCRDCGSSAGTCEAACSDSSQCAEGLSCASGICWDACLCGGSCDTGDDEPKEQCTTTPECGDGFCDTVCNEQVTCTADCVP